MTCPICGDALRRDMRTCGRAHCNRNLIRLARGAKEDGDTVKARCDLRKCGKQRFDLDHDDYSEGSRP